MRVSAFVLLLIGCAWFVFNALLVVTLAGISKPVSLTAVISYWSAMCAGPLMLTSGSLLLFCRRSSRVGVILVSAGCVFLTAYAIYNTVGGLQRKPLQAPPPYVFYGALLAVVIVADLALFRVWRTQRGGGSGVPLSTTNRVG